MGAASAESSVKVKGPREPPALRVFKALPEEQEPPVQLVLPVLRVSQVLRVSRVQSAEQELLVQQVLPVQPA